MKRFFLLILLSCLAQTAFSAGFLPAIRGAATTQAPTGPARVETKLPPIESKTYDFSLKGKQLPRAFVEELIFLQGLTSAAASISLNAIGLLYENKSQKAYAQFKNAMYQKIDAGVSRQVAETTVFEELAPTLGGEHALRAHIATAKAIHREAAEHAVAFPFPVKTTPGGPVREDTPTYRLVDDLRFEVFRGFIELGEVSVARQLQGLTGGRRKMMEYATLRSWEFVLLNQHSIRANLKQIMEKRRFTLDCDAIDWDAIIPKSPGEHKPMISHILQAPEAVHPVFLAKFRKVVDTLGISDQGLRLQDHFELLESRLSRHKVDMAKEEAEESRQEKIAALDASIAAIDTQIKGGLSRQAKKAAEEAREAAEEAKTAAETDQTSEDEWTRILLERRKEFYKEGVTEEEEREFKGYRTQHPDLKLSRQEIVFFNKLNYPDF